MYQEEDLWLWLCGTDSLYRPQIKTLLDYFQSPGELFLASEQEILSLPAPTAKVKQTLLKRRASFDPEKERHSLTEQGIRFFSHRHSAYPSALLEIYDYPYGLYVKGHLPQPKKKAAAIVGARLCSSYGRHWAAQIAGHLAGLGVSLISGMARGIDGIAQRAALDAGGEVFAVLGSGADVCYPRENRTLYRDLAAQGGILSEYPPGSAPLAFHFPLRNRIISGLSGLVIVVEAKEKSGSLITADTALEQGRDVMAVPGRAGDRLSEGTNALIAQGADIFLSLERLTERLNIFDSSSLKNKKTEVILEKDENLVYSVLEFQTKSLQQIVDETALAPGTAAAVLVRLILKGLAVENTKNDYARV